MIESHDAQGEGGEGSGLAFFYVFVCAHWPRARWINLISACQWRLYRGHAYPSHSETKKPGMEIRHMHGLAHQVI